MDRPVEPKDNLPRLLRHHYQGHAVVMWTLTMEHRTTGWLNELFHLYSVFSQTRLQGLDFPADAS
jgi:hypothetical protein